MSSHDRRSAGLDFSGSTVLVIGAGGGIGSVVAERFAAAGAVVIAAARRVDGPLRDVVDRIEAAGGSAHALVIDVTDEDSVRAAVQSAAGIPGASTRWRTWHRLHTRCIDEPGELRGLCRQ